MAHTRLPISEREREVVRLLADGLTAREIGKRLGISDGTVRNHRMNVYRKLGINRAVTLARWAVQHHLTRRNGRKRSAA